jgi:cobalt-zinc-cadmium resistance protein CzcA
MQYQNALLQYQKDLEKLDYFEKTALSNAQTIIETAKKQFYNGEINYLDWVLLTNQSITIKSNYIDTVIHHNNLIIQLNYLTSKQ